MKISILSSLVATSLVMATLACTDSVDQRNLPSPSGAKESASTAQGIMADLDVTPVTITQGVVYTFNKDLAKTYYTTSAPSGPTVTSGNNPAPATPAAPAPDPIGNNDVLKDKCIFYSGGKLPDYTYTKTVNLPKGWKYTYTYAVTGATVAPLTAWDSKVTGGEETAEVPVNVTIAGLSALSSKTHPLKYSFSLLADDGLTSRVTDLKITITNAEGTVVSETPISSSIVNGTDFRYMTNAGTNGNYVDLIANTTVTNYLGYNANGKMASDILLFDSFSGNNASSNITCAKGDEVKPVLGVGEYTVTLTGVVKGNAASNSTTVSVSKKVIVSGNCN
ncbi:hypothetical protein A6C57_15310 [Fibrella sp. ES10-3-2-2]